MLDLARTPRVIAECWLQRKDTLDEIKAEREEAERLEREREQRKERRRDR